MNWLEISIQAQHEGAAEAICQLFDLYGQGGAVQEQVYPSQTERLSDVLPPTTLKTYVPPADGNSGRRRTIESELYRLVERYSLGPPRFRELEEKDWANAWKDHFHPQRIGARLVFKLPEQDYHGAEDDIVIDLDPGMAFGTGLHPTTRMCLIALEGRLKAGDRVLDMGTGSGILAIAAARLGADSVLALDDDATAVGVARSNVSLNGLSDVVEVRRASLGYLSENPVRPLSGIVVNILAKVITSMVEHGLASHLKSGGWLIAGGIVEGAETTLSAVFDRFGMRVIDRREEADWVTLSAIKLGPTTHSELRLVGA